MSVPPPPTPAPTVKPWHWSRTVWIGVLTTVLGLVPLLLPDLIDLLKLLNMTGQQLEVFSGVAVAILGILSVVRRFMLDPTQPPAALK